MFSEDIGVYESLIFGNTPWKLHSRGVCIGRWQWQHSASDRTPNSSEPQICSGRFSTVIWLRLDAKIVEKAQSVANSSVALPAWMLHVHQMAPIQLDSVTILLKKLLVGHTRSISGPILRGRYFRLTTSLILSEKICCLWCVRLLCTPPCGIPRLPPASFYVGLHSVNPLPIAPNEVVNKQWYRA